MKYLVYILNSRTNELEKKYDSDSLEKAEKYIEKSKAKHKELVKFPELRIGSVLYSKGKLYGVITHETESLFVITKPTYVEGQIPCYYLKDGMLEHFIKKDFDPIEEYAPEDKPAVKKKKDKE